MSIFNWLCGKNNYKFIPVNSNGITGIISKEKQEIDLKNKTLIKFPKKTIDFNKNNNIHEAKFFDTKSCIRKINIIIPSFTGINDFIKSVKIYSNDKFLYNDKLIYDGDTSLFRNKVTVIDNKMFIILKIAILVKIPVLSRLDDFLQLDQKSHQYRIVIEYNELYREYIDQVKYLTKYITFDYSPYNI